MSAPIPLEDAWDKLFALARPLESERTPVDDAAGRWLAEDIPARLVRPFADLSAMDGFAVRGAGPWTIVGESRAGHHHAGTLSDGEAVRISTGAACPEGTESIVIVENAEVDGEVLTAPRPDAGKHIRRRGFDFTDGELLLARGSRIGAAQLALARSGGHGELPVSRQPAVAVLEGGDELVSDPQNCPPDKLPASNGAMVAAMVRSAGGIARTIGPLPDDRAMLASAIAEAGYADVIVTTAGASVGAHDHVRGALEDCGADLTFWRVAIRPGKPLLVARLGQTIVLGLPGNPASAYVTAFLFVLPLLRFLQGASVAVPRAIDLPTSRALPHGGDRREFLRARFADGGVQPLQERDSSALRILAEANLLIDRPAHARRTPPGAPVPCYWLENGGIA